MAHAECASPGTALSASRPTGFRHLHHLCRPAGRPERICKFSTTHYTMLGTHPYTLLRAAHCQSSVTSYVPRPLFPSRWSRSPAFSTFPRADSRFQPNLSESCRETAKLPCDRPWTTSAECAAALCNWREFGGRCLAT